MYQTHGMENECTSSLEEIKDLNRWLQQLNEETNIARDESKLELELIKAKQVKLHKVCTSVQPSPSTESTMTSAFIRENPTIKHIVVDSVSRVAASVSTHKHWHFMLV